MSDLEIMSDLEMMSDLERLRKLAAWYREFAERTGNPTIWEMRLSTAERLEAEADRIECHLPASSQRSRARTSQLVDHSE
jgi:hypothetical protein